MKRNRQGHHESVVDDLEERLKSIRTKSGKPYYDFIYRDVPYAQHPYVGQFDIYTKKRIGKNTYHHYYEVKSSHNRSNYKKALKQFYRVHAAYHTLHWKFIYVTPQLVRRVTLK